MFYWVKKKWTFRRHPVGILPGVRSSTSSAARSSTDAGLWNFDFSQISIGGRVFHVAGQIIAVVFSTEFLAQSRAEALALEGAARSARRSGRLHWSGGGTAGRWRRSSPFDGRILPLFWVAYTHHIFHWQSQFVRRLLSCKIQQLPSIMHLKHNRTTRHICKRWTE